MSRTVFILGAGASAEAGGPVMTSFVDRAEELHRSQALDSNAPIKKAFDLFFRARALLQEVHAKANVDLYNVEAVLGAFEMGGLLNRLGRLTAEEILELPVATRRVITATLESSILFNHEPDNRILPPKPYQEFVNLIGEISKSRSGPASVITFNYDVALDYAVRFVGVPIDYCFDEPVASALPLMKLHGSLNWAQCAKCEKVLPLLTDEYFKQRRIFGRAPDGTFRLPISVDVSQKQHCGEPCQTTPLIVPPTWNKAQYHRSIGKVWERAARELSDAENIIIVGYSLPNSDEFFHYFLPLGIVGPNIIGRIMVLDPNEQVGEHYRRLLSQAVLQRFEMVPSKFSDAIHTIRARLGLHRNAQ